MKRLIAFLTMLIMLFTLIPAAVIAEEEPAATPQPELVTSLKVNSKWQDYDLKLVILERANYQLLAIARPFAQSIGAEIKWNDERQELTFKRNDKVATIAIGSDVGYANGVEKKLETPAQLIDDTSYVPVEFVGDALDYHVIEQDYGRTIRLVKKTDLTAPYYDKQGIKPGMAELKSTVHRPVPTEFEKSNRLDDLYYFEDFEYVPEEELTKEIVLDESNIPHGEVIYTMDDFLSGIPDNPGPWCGRWNKVDIDDEGVDFDKALELQCWYKPTNTVDWICKSSARLKEYVDPNEKFLISFWARTVSGGNIDTGRAKCYVHCEESYIPTWIKSLSQTIEFGVEWRQFHFLMTGVENANHFGIQPGFEIQTFQIADWTVEKLPDDADVSELKKANELPNLLLPELSKDAPWRQEALDRIEKVRKGDFKVKVVDKNGNPVEGASVEFDMFEHEFEIGAALDGDFWNPGNGGYVQDDVKVLAPLFNSVGCGNGLKMNEFVSNPQISRRIFDDCANLGIKNFRLHSTWMPTLTDGNGDRPYTLFGPDQAENMDWDTFENYVKEHINRLVKTVPEVVEFEGSNEMTNRVTYDKFGREYLMEVYKWCKEVMPDYVLLTLCDNQSDNEKYWKTLDMFQENNIDYDVLANQGHTAATTVRTTPTERTNHIRPTERLLVFDRYAYEYEKACSISEFSTGAPDQEMAAAIARDSLIAFFSHPACRAVTSFWLTDAYAEKTSPVPPAVCYDANFNLKLAGKVWADLFYNKWWTKDEVTVTDAEGKGQIRGYYGDYDLTVSVNGKVVKTLMAAYHRGYENELTITLDN